MHSRSNAWWHLEIIISSPTSLHRRQTGTGEKEADGLISTLGKGRALI